MVLKNLIKEVIMFRERNKVLFYLLIISIFIYFSYYFSRDLDEWFTGAEFLYKLGNDLSLAYMGSFIFYVVQVYIPETRKNNVIKKSIQQRLNKILVELIDPIKYTNKYFLNEDSNDEIFSDEKINKISQNIELFRRSGKFNGRGETLSTLEYMYINNMKIKQEVECIYKALGIYLEVELINILNEIDNVDEYNFIQRTKEFYIIFENNKVNNKHNINLDDMYINPSKYDSYSTKGLYEYSISQMFKKQCRLYEELKSYYLKM